MCFWCTPVSALFRENLPKQWVVTACNCIWYHQSLNLQHKYGTKKYIINEFHYTDLHSVSLTDPRRFCRLVGWKVPANFEKISVIYNDLCQVRKKKHWKKNPHLIINAIWIIELFCRKNVILTPTEVVILTIMSETMSLHTLWASPSNERWAVACLPTDHFVLSQSCLSATCGWELGGFSKLMVNFNHVGRSFNLFMATTADVWIILPFRIWGYMLHVEHISCVITNCGQHQWVILSLPPEPVLKNMGQQMSGPDISNG